MIFRVSASKTRSENPSFRLHFQLWIKKSTDAFALMEIQIEGNFGAEMVWRKCASIGVKMFSHVYFIVCAFITVYNWLKSKCCGPCSPPRTCACNHVSSCSAASRSFNVWMWLPLAVHFPKWLWAAQRNGFSLLRASAESLMVSFSTSEKVQTQSEWCCRLPCQAVLKTNKKEKGGEKSDLIPDFHSR